MSVHPRKVAAAALDHSGGVDDQGVKPPWHTIHAAQYVEIVRISIDTSELESSQLGTTQQGSRPLPLTRAVHVPLAAGGGADVHSLECAWVWAKLFRSILCYTGFQFGGCPIDKTDLHALAIASSEQEAARAAMFQRRRVRALRTRPVAIQHPDAVVVVAECNRLRGFPLYLEVFLPHPHDAIPGIYTTAHVSLPCGLVFYHPG